MKKCNKIISVMAYSIKIMFQMDKPYLFWLSASMIIAATIPFINANLISTVISLVFTENRLEEAIITACAMLIALTILQIIEAYVMWHRSNHYLSMGHGFDILMAQKTIDMKYEKAENPQISDMRVKAARGCNAVQLAGEAMTDMGANIIKMISCGVVFTMFNPLIMLVVLPFSALNYFFGDYFQKRFYAEEQKEHNPRRRSEYYLDVMLDYVAGKEIRLFEASDFFKGKYFEQEDALYKINQKKQKHSLADRFIGVLIVVIQLLFLYLLVGKEYLKGGAGIGDVSLYVNLVLIFSGAFAGFFGSFITIGWQGERLKDLEKYLEIEDEEIQNEKASIEKEFIAIVFEHVWFRYEGASDYTLKDVNLEIKKGDKLAIVGENGSGKTTIIKLLMRFYTPTKGRILVDGKDYLTIKRSEYYTLFATVFQDFNLSAFTIRENIGSVKDKKDEERMKLILERLELWEKISTLPKGLDTPISNEFETDGVNFSGGERQKLSIARAEYKEAPIMVLDEPTSALDPIAEKKLYDKLLHIMEDKTMLMISHRLQSTVICTKIVFVKNGHILENGNHDELMRLEGEYANMYRLQAGWYQEKE